MEVIVICMYCGCGLHDIEVWEWRLNSFRIYKRRRCPACERQYAHPDNMPRPGSHQSPQPLGVNIDYGRRVNPIDVDHTYYNGKPRYPEDWEPKD